MAAGINLDQLHESVFKIHEEVFESEDDLFTLHTSLDDIMARNPQAKADGVFRATLAPNLRGKGTPLSTFWSLFGDEAKKKLQAQFLLTDVYNKQFAMEVKAIKAVVDKSNSFAKTVKLERTFKDPAPNCCTDALENCGPKAAVKHFYEALQSMSLNTDSECNEMVKEENPPTQMKSNFLERQKLLLGHSDPITKCASIELSMRSKTYFVTPGSGLYMCMCERCCKNKSCADFLSSKVTPKEDGSGDTCSFYFNGIEESLEKFMYITPNFALSHLCHLNMLTDLKAYYAGISFPFVYVGGLHSVFPMHIEDMSLWSINYHHMGYPKLIIVVAPCDVLKVSLILSHYGLSYLHQSCLYKLSHKSTVVLPLLLLSHNIKFKIIFQKPGDFIFFAPNAAHTGGNMGPNINEACNIGTVTWLPYGSVASHNHCNCMEAEVHMDMTSLIKVHCKELLPYHLNKTSDRIGDEFFRHSIIVAPESYTSPEEPAASLPRPSSCASVAAPRKAGSTTWKTCPVPKCLKRMKSATRTAMEMHITKMHPGKAEDKAVQDELLKLFPRSKDPSIQSPCPDCGKLLSVFTNKHRGTNACVKLQLPDS